VRSHVSELARPRRGHFDLGTGNHGDLWLDLDGLFLFPERLRPDVQRLADRLGRYQPGAVCGPLAGGAFLALMIAGMLGAAFLPAYPGPGRRRRAAGHRPGQHRGHRYSRFALPRRHDHAQPGLAGRRLPPVPERNPA